MSDVGCQETGPEAKLLDSVNSVTINKGMCLVLIQNGIFFILIISHWTNLL